MGHDHRYDRAALLLAADLSPEQVADETGLGLLLLNRWLDTARGQRQLYLAVIAYHAIVESAQITGHRARGFLPIPLVLCPDFDEDEDDEDDRPLA